MQQNKTKRVEKPNVVLSGVEKMMALCSTDWFTVYGTRRLDYSFGTRAITGVEFHAKAFFNGHVKSLKVYEVYKYKFAGSFKPISASRLNAFLFPGMSWAPQMDRNHITPAHRVRIQEASLRGFQSNPMDSRASMRPGVMVDFKPFLKSFIWRRSESLIEGSC